MVGLIAFPAPRSFESFLSLLLTLKQAQARVSCHNQQWNQFHYIIQRRPLGYKIFHLSFHLAINKFIMPLSLCDLPLEILTRISVMVKVKNLSAVNKHLRSALLPIIFKRIEISPKSKYVNPTMLCNLTNIVKHLSIRVPSYLGKSVMTEAATSLAIMLFSFRSIQHFECNLPFEMNETIWALLSEKANLRSVCVKYAGHSTNALSCLSRLSLLEDITLSAMHEDMPLSNLSQLINERREFLTKLSFGFSKEGDAEIEDLFHRVETQLKLQSLALQAFRWSPADAPSPLRKLDLTKLRNLSLKSCLGQERAWDMFNQVSADRPQNLKSIFVDQISPPLIKFLTETLEPNMLEALFFDGRDTSVKLETILKGPVSRHRRSLLNVFLRNRDSQDAITWKFSEADISFIFREIPQIRQLAFAINARDSILTFLRQLTKNTMLQGLRIFQIDAHSPAHFINEFQHVLDSFRAPSLMEIAYKDNYYHVCDPDATDEQDEDDTGVVPVLLRIVDRCDMELDIFEEV